MYKVYFEESFFIWLDDFVGSMKDYYYTFYSNTWLYDVEKIVEWYFNKYEKLKTDILNKIDLICKDWILWRKVLYSFDNIENCIFTFTIWNYKIIFTAIINQIKQEVIISTIKIET